MESTDLSETAIVAKAIRPRLDGDGWRGQSKAFRHIVDETQRASRTPGENGDGEIVTDALVLRARHCSG